MEKPVIGIPRMGTDPFRRYMQGKYITCLEHAGAKVEILEPDPGEGAIRRYLKLCDGFLFPGGSDIDPSRYGKDRLPACGKANPERDGFEIPLLGEVLEAKRPLLCICRGMQVLNVVCGGTILQDIKAQQKYKHVDTLHRTGSTHPVKLAPGSLLEEIFGCRIIPVNSLHHQVVDQVGKGLRVTALSPEHFIEGLELKNPTFFCLGVQWHPEHMKAPVQQKLFERLIKAC